MPTSSTAAFDVSNHLTAASQSGGAAFLYDAAGNVTNDGANLYLYDAEGRICAVNTTSNLNSSHPGLIGYIYDADGIRVAKGTLTRFTCDFNPADSATTYNGFAATTSWALGQVGEQVGEWQLTGGAWTWQHSNVSAGKLLGTYDTKGFHFYFNDWLGSRRIQTNPLGQLEQTCQSLPYGNGLNCTLTSLATADEPTEQHFTGKEGDTESGNDYFGARYYASNMGRFVSPDPSQLALADITNPQSLNLYSYALNNPLLLTDPTGLGPCPDTPVLASPGLGDGGGDDPCDQLTPPPMPPEDPGSGKYQPDPISDANSMGIILGILAPNCLMQGLRNSLAAGETPNEPDNGYGTIVKGTVTSAPPQYSSLIGQTNVHLDPSTLSAHPGIHVHFGTGSGPGSYSTAAGRYQILQRYAPTPFYPQNQDAYANSELKSVGARTDAMNGDFAAAIADAGTRWQSMPGSNLGGKQIPLTTVANAFLQGISGCKAN